MTFTVQAHFIIFFADGMSCECNAVESILYLNAKLNGI